jgi:hypothetical protein
MRLKCEIVRSKHITEEELDEDEVAEAADWTSPNPRSTFAVLNELVVDRGHGALPSLSAKPLPSNHAVNVYEVDRGHSDRFRTGFCT